MLDCPDLDGWGEAHGGGAWGLGESIYVRVLQKILPPGLALTRRTCSNLTKLLAGFAEECDEVGTTRSEDVLAESDPRTTQELISQWESVLGLPGACDATPPTTLPDRRSAVLAKLRSRQSQDRSRYEDIADGLGYGGGLTYSHYEPFTCTSDCNHFLYVDQWQYAVLITGSSDSLDSSLVCLITQAAPLHTTIVVELS